MKPNDQVSGKRRLIFSRPGFTDLIIGVFGPDRGAHARTAVGLADLPFRIPVKIEGEVELHLSAA